MNWLNETYSNVSGKVVDISKRIIEESTNETEDIYSQLQVTREKCADLETKLSSLETQLNETQDQLKEAQSLLTEERSQHEKSVVKFNDYIQVLKAQSRQDPEGQSNSTPTKVKDRDEPVQHVPQREEEIRQLKDELERMRLETKKWFQLAKEHSKRKDESVASRSECAKCKTVKLEVSLQTELFAPVGEPAGDEAAETSSLMSAQTRQIDDIVIQMQSRLRECHQRMNRSSNEEPRTQQQPSERIKQVNQELARLREKLRQPLGQLAEEEAPRMNDQARQHESEMVQLREAVCARDQAVAQYEQMIGQLKLQQQNDQDVLGQIKSQLQERETQLQAQAQQTRQLVLERDQVMANSQRLQTELSQLRQTQGEFSALQVELNQLRGQHTSSQQLCEKDQLLQEATKQNIELKMDVQRLGEYLQEMEQNYTEQALEAEKREVELVERANQAENKLTRMHSELSETSKVRYELQTAQSEVSLLQKELQSLRQENANLLGLMRQKPEAAHSEELLASLQKQAQVWQKQIVQLQNERDQLAQSMEARVKAEVDRQQEQMTRLQGQVRQRDQIIVELRETIHSVKNESVERSGNSIDKVLMRNLLSGYFKCAEIKRPDALRMIAQILDYSEAEMRTQLPVGAPSSRASGIYNWIKSNAPKVFQPQTPANLPPIPADKSFSELFMEFLERESHEDTVKVSLPEDFLVPIAAPNSFQSPENNHHTAPSGLNSTDDGSAAEDVPLVLHGFAPAPQLDFIINNSMQR